MIALKGNLPQNYRTEDAKREQQKMDQIDVSRSAAYTPFNGSLPALAADLQIHPRRYQARQEYEPIRCRGEAEGIEGEPLQRVLRQMRKRHKDEEITPQAVDSPVSRHIHRVSAISLPSKPN